MSILYFKVVVALEPSRYFGLSFVLSSSTYMQNNTLGFYDSHAAQYAERKTAPSPRLHAFLDRCKTGGRILELGTGGGADASAILQAGFVLDATDGSAELAAIASRRIGQTVQVMQFTELAATETYDGIYACASLTHAAKQDLPLIFEKIHAALVSGGVVWASFKTGTAEGTDMFGRYYNRPSVDELLKLWRASAPWASIDSESWSGHGYDKQSTTWTAITAFR